MKALFSKIENNERIDRQELIAAGVHIVSSTEMHPAFKVCRIHPRTVVGRLERGLFNFTEANLSGLRLVGSWGTPEDEIVDTRKPVYTVRSTPSNKANSLFEEYQAVNMQERKLKLTPSGSPWLGFGDSAPAADPMDTTTGFGQQALNKTTNETTETKMTNIVKIAVLDNDPALDINSVVVHVTKELAVRNTQDAQVELSARGLFDFSKILAKANETRAKQLDVKKTELMGREVFLFPIEWKDLTVTVITVL